MVQKIRLNIIFSTIIFFILIMVIFLISYYSKQKDRKYNGIFVYADRYLDYSIT